MYKCVYKTSYFDRNDQLKTFKNVYNKNRIVCQFLRIRFHCNDNIAFIEIYLTFLPFKPDRETHIHIHTLYNIVISYCDSVCELHQIDTMFIILHNGYVIQFKKSGYIQFNWMIVYSMLKC